jgi:DNA-binding transcriptional ArsR family regulator
MEPVEYLIPSRARRELLRVLQAASKGMTVRAMARQARVAYSNAHREVDRMAEAGLIRRDRVGNALVCSWNRANRGARAVATLLETRPGDDAVYWNLRGYGAPLLRPGIRGTRMKVEETLAHSLLLARRDPHVAQVWPIVLAKNKGSLDLAQLESLAKRLGQKKALGFLLSVSGWLLKDPRIVETARRLRDKRFRKMEDFFLVDHGMRASQLSKRRTPPLARKWFFWANLSLESLESSFRKFIRET